MGAFLAALGAVLLFILRVIGHSAAGGADLTGAVAAVPLLRRPVLGARCAHRKGRCAGHHLPVFQYPKPEPLPAPEIRSRPGLWQGQGKVCRMRAERKRKKAEEKARKKAAAAAAKANKPAQPRKKAKITLDVICTMLRAWVRCCGQCLARSALQGFRSAWCARGRPRRSCPQLRQAASVAVPDPWRAGPFLLSGI